MKIFKLFAHPNTAAVYRGLGGLEPAFTHRHWAGLRDRTHPFGLAVPCVFVKQSLPPCHCDLRSHPGRLAEQDSQLETAGTPSSEHTGPICRFP